MSNKKTKTRKIKNNKTNVKVKRKTNKRIKRKSNNTRKKKGGGGGCDSNVEKVTSEFAKRINLSKQQVENFLHSYFMYSKNTKKYKLKEDIVGSIGAPKTKPESVSLKYSDLLKSTITHKLSSHVQIKNMNKNLYEFSNEQSESELYYFGLEISGKQNTILVDGDIQPNIKDECCNYDILDLGFFKKITNGIFTKTHFLFFLNHNNIYHCFDINDNKVINRIKNIYLFSFNYDSTPLHSVLITDDNTPTEPIIDIDINDDPLNATELVCNNDTIKNQLIDAKFELLKVENEINKLIEVVHNAETQIQSKCDAIKYYFYKRLSEDETDEPFYESIDSLNDIVNEMIQCDKTLNYANTDNNDKKNKLKTGLKEIKEKLNEINNIIIELHNIIDEQVKIPTETCYNIASIEYLNNASDKLVNVIGIIDKHFPT